MLKHLNYIFSKTLQGRNGMPYISIDHGRVSASNGTYTLSTHVKELESIKGCFDGKRLIKACSSVNKEDCCFTQTGKINLIVKDKVFRAIVPSVVEYLSQEIDTSPKHAVVADNILSNLIRVFHFTGDDSLYEWTKNILFSGGYMYATNRLMVVRCKLNNVTRRVVIPRATIAELIRLKEEIKKIEFAEKRITFYTEHFTLSSCLIDKEWPDIENYFDSFPSDIAFVDNKIVDGVNALSPFCLSDTFPVLFFDENGIATNKEGDSSTYSITDLPNSCFSVHQLKLLLPHVEKINWQQKPEWIFFSGYDDTLQGIFAGHVQE